MLMFSQLLRHVSIVFPLKIISASTAFMLIFFESRKYIAIDFSESGASFVLEI